jgi:tellurite resistance protein TerC
MIKALHLHEVPPFVRRVIIAVIGGTILLIGLVLLVLPGPALLVIPLGLAILGTEFVWARRWLQKARAMLKETKDRITGGGR